MAPSNGGFVRRSWARVRAYEPARLRAGWTAVIALLATQGISVSAELDGRVQIGLAVAAVVLPLLQGEATRAAVYSPATAAKIATSAAEMAALDVPTPQAAATAVDTAGDTGVVALPADAGAVED